MFQRTIRAPLASGRSFFLFGPRGTGKTTWLKQQFPHALFINLLQSEFHLPLAAEPGRLREFIPTEYAGWVVIDEIQRVPELLNEVHELIESRGLRFALTGSSARSLRRKGVNLLGGRARTRYMHPLTAAEQGKAFSLADSLKFGNLPARFGDPDPAAYLDSYIATYLKEEVAQEGLTRNLGSFTRFLETAAFSQGQALNISGVAREARVARATAENYFSIVEDLLIATSLPVFSRRARRELTTQRKFYFFDAGVFRAIRPMGPLDSEAEIDGPALETLVLQELRAINDYSSLGHEISYWRTRHGLEVDFVLYGPRGLIAIEVKRTRSPGPKDYRSLREFKKDYPPAECFLLHGGDTPLYLGGITAMPITLALPKLEKILSGERPGAAEVIEKNSTPAKAKGLEDRES